MIGVSSATVRNWAKSGQICPVSTRPLSFLKESVLNLKNQVGSASFERLKTRANKLGSTNNFLPEEYAENKNLIRHIANIVNFVKEERLEIGAVMLLAALRLLEATGEVNKRRIQV